mmetsp:Transcript_116007/g.323104  ORF Transcript_116007/g.323104 Transcript_116007/m.323104 type:complete len:222 (+) Transcript_116007:180-845(+)
MRSCRLDEGQGRHASMASSAPPRARTRRARVLVAASDRQWQERRLGRWDPPPPEAEQLWAVSWRPGFEAMRQSASQSPTPCSASRCSCSGCGCLRCCRSRRLPRAWRKASGRSARNPRARRRTPRCSSAALRWASLRDERPAPGASPRLAPAALTKKIIGAMEVTEEKGRGPSVKRSRSWEPVGVQDLERVNGRSKLKEKIPEEYAIWTPRHWTAQAEAAG